MITIRGMDMPKDGEISHVRIYPNGNVTVEIDKEEFVIAYAVEVPTPHGRLIDEQRLNMQIHTAKEIYANEKRDFCNAFDSNGRICTEWWCVEEMIDNAPTIIPAEEDINNAERC